MGLNRYVDGAWEQKLNAEKPDVDGAREAAVAACVYRSGAWENILMQLLSMSVTDGFYNSTLAWFIGQGLTTWLFAVPPTGGCSCYLEAGGLWEDPTVACSADVESDAVSVLDNLYSHWNTTVTLEATDSTGKVHTVNVFTPDGYASTDSAEFSHTLTGTYTKMRFVIYTEDGGAGCGNINLHLNNIRIDGQAYGALDRIQT